jgi:hypothetical protein
MNGGMLGKIADLPCREPSQGVVGSSNVRTGVAEG